MISCTTIGADGTQIAGTSCDAPQPNGIPSVVDGAVFHGLGSTITEVQAELASKLSAVQGTTVQLPRKYGETRDTYNMTTAKQGAGVVARYSLRHPNSEKGGAAAFALNLSDNDDGVLSDAFFGWETDTAPELFLYNENTWVRSEIKRTPTLARDDILEGQCYEYPALQPANQYRFYTAANNGSECDGGADELFYTQAAAYEETKYGAPTGDAYAWHHSSLGAQQAANLVVCNEATVEFHSEVSKNTRDDREPSGTVDVNKTYTDAQYAAYADIRADLAAGGAVHGYKLDGATVTVQTGLAGVKASETISGQIFVSDEMGTVTGKDITITDADKDTLLEYSCAPGDFQLRDYKNDYNMPCGNESATVSVEDVRHSVLYTEAQVTYKAPAGTSNSVYDEWSIQHETLTHSFDLTLDEDYGLRWDNTSSVSATISARHRHCCSC